MSQSTSSPAVLVIDPDPSVRALLLAVLRRQGYRAESAEDSEGALGLHRSTRHAAVIVDPRVLGGETLLQELRQAVPDGDPNIIVVTTPDFTTGPPYRSCRGVCAVLFKPFLIDELAAAVARCCDGDGR